MNFRSSVTRTGTAPFTGNIDQLEKVVANFREAFPGQPIPNLDTWVDNDDNRIGQFNIEHRSYIEADGDVDADWANGNLFPVFVAHVAKHTENIGFTTIEHHPEYEPNAITWEVNTSENKITNRDIDGGEIVHTTSVLRNEYDELNGVTIQPE
jgi:hypothetical protein